MPLSKFVEISRSWIASGPPQHKFLSLNKLDDGVIIFFSCKRPLVEVLNVSLDGHGNSHVLPDSDNSFDEK